MSELEKALEVHRELCDLFDAYLLADDENGNDDTERAHDALFHKFINGGEQAMHRLADFVEGLTSPETKVWLCREGDERMQNWAYGTEPDDPHCWFNGPRKHNPECGEYAVLRSVEEQDHV